MKLLISIIFLIVVINTNAQCNLNVNSTQGGLGVNTTIFQAPIELSGTPIGTYLWDFGDGFHGLYMENHCSHDYPAPGNYEVILKVIDLNDNLCTDTFNVNILSETCQGGFVALSNPKNWNSYTFHAQVNGIPPYTYEWNIGGITSTNSYQLMSPNQEICLTVGDNNSSYDIDCDSIFAVTNPHIVEVFNNIAPSLGCDGHIAVKDSLMFDFCQGILVADPVGSVDFNSMWKVGDTLFFNTCAVVNAIGLVGMFGSFEANLCSTTYLDETASLETKFSSEEVELYPNPSNSVVYLNNWVNDKRIEYYKITDLNGRVLVISQTDNSETSIIELPDSVGIYILNIFLENMVLKKKVIKI